MNNAIFKKNFEYNSKGIRIGIILLTLCIVFEP